MFLRRGVVGFVGSMMVGIGCKAWSNIIPRLDFVESSFVC
jgi:hypothetical protein